MQSNRGEQVYRFVEYDQRDTSQVQMYLRVINAATYLNFTYINPIDLEWFESLVEDDLIAFYQDGMSVLPRRCLPLTMLKTGIV